MSEVTEYPHFVISPRASEASRDFALSVEEAINDNPMAMSEGLFAFRALRSVVNVGKDIQKLAKEQGFETGIDELTTTELMWRNYENDKVYQYVSFDPDTEAEADSDPEVVDLINKIRGSEARSGDREKLSLDMRNLWLGIFIKRVQIAKSQPSGISS